MEHKHNSNIGKRLLALLLFIVTIPLVIVGVVFFGIIYVLTTVLPSPIERIIYKKSEFYKDLKAKYTLGITRNFAFKSYKYVKQNENLELVVQDEGYYYYKTNNSILVIPYYPRYEYENREWMISMDEGKSKLRVVDLKGTFAPLIKENIDELDLKLLVKEKFFKEHHFLLAKDDPVFVFYKNEKDFASIKI